MEYLLDTHAFLWFLNGSDELSQKAKNAILNTDNVKYISIASLWEIAIKLNLGKLEIGVPYKKIKEQIIKDGFQILPIQFEDTFLLTSLELKHRDPFDRIIISQAMRNKFSIITKDSNFKFYNVKTLW